VKYEESTIEGRNAVLESLKSGKPVDKLLVQEGAGEGSVNTILREAKKAGVVIEYVPKERLDAISKTGRHQGVIVSCAAYEYAEV
jgi:23S rRNA (guanosine2251-2'-O)-methyltransferase